MVGWGDFKLTAPRFRPEGIATRATLAEWLKRLGLPVSKSLADYGTSHLTRALAAQHLWHALQIKGEWFPASAKWLQPNHDDDRDGRQDYVDPLPFDHDNNNVPDRLQPPTAIAFATAAGCLAYSIGGDFNFSSREEIEALMNGDASGRVKR